MITARQILAKYWINSVTLNNWRRAWKLKYQKINDRFFLYEEDFFEKKKNDAERISVVYARVSTSKQKKDLDNQIKLLQKYCLKNWIKTEVYSDIWSWLNENRNWLNKLLEDVCKNKIDTIYITYKDRLSRFWFWYLEKLCELHWTEIEVLEWTVDWEEEIVEDLIAVIHNYSAKMYSARRKQFKKVKEILWT